MKRRFLVINSEMRKYFRVLAYMAEINLGVGIGISVPNLHMAEIVPELRFVAGALHLACAFPLAGLSSGRKETYADACFLGWKFPMELICVVRTPQTDFSFEACANQSVFPCGG